MVGSKRFIRFLSRCMYADDMRRQGLTLVTIRYHDMNHERYGALRVINEDRVASHTGFGTHSHREFEIFSYVVEGELEQYVAHIVLRYT